MVVSATSIGGELITGQVLALEASKARVVKEGRGFVPRYARSRIMTSDDKISILDWVSLRCYTAQIRKQSADCISPVRSGIKSNPG